VCASVEKLFVGREAPVLDILQSNEVYASGDTWHFFCTSRWL